MRSVAGDVLCALGGALAWADGPDASPPAPLIRFDAVLPVGLGAVQGALDGGDEAVRVVGVRGNRGDTDRARHLDLAAAVDAERLARDGHADALGDARCGVRVGAVEDDREFPPP